MTLYLDTSLLVAALTREAETGRIQAWLGAREADDLAISAWVATEFASALSIKMRSGRINAGNRADALAMFTRLSPESLAILPVPEARFHAAARFADQYALGLRAGDALHLAICAGHGATLCTLDRRLSEAGPVVGVRTLLV